MKCNRYFFFFLVFILGESYNCQRILRRRKPVDGTEIQIKLKDDTESFEKDENLPGKTIRFIERGRSVGRNRGFKARKQQRGRGMQRVRRPPLRRPSYDYYNYYYDDYYEYYDEDYYQEESPLPQRINKGPFSKKGVSKEVLLEQSTEHDSKINFERQESPDYGPIIKKLWEEFLSEKTSGDFKASKVADEEYECSPREESYFEPDEQQCDKYFECNIKGEIKEHLCPDGFTFDITLEKCDYPVKVNCSTRPNLQDPKPSTNCSRANGFFPWPANISCQNFWDCREGRAYKQTCPVGVIFDPLLNTCATPDQSTRQECKEGESNFLGFTCPKYTEESVLKFGNHDRLAHPDNCLQYFSCLKSGEPRLATCPRKKVFNNATGQCTDPKNVPGCETYWIDKLKGEEDYYYDY